LATGSTAQAVQTASSSQNARRPTGAVLDAKVTSPINLLLCRHLWDHIETGTALATRSQRLRL